ncbi:MAG: sugar phosphate nucleotidyltransferase, partial [Candidatus Kapaibacterium sp.]
MKALITAGGRGTRLRPITHTQNKHLIPIANKPILRYAIDAVKEAGITDIGIVVGVDNGAEVERAFGDGSALGVRFTYIWQEAPLGLAHVVKISHDFIGDDPFVFYLGDNIVVGGITRFVDAFNVGDLDCYLTLARVRDPERFGVPEFDGAGKIIAVQEKPESPKSPFAVSGIYIYGPAIFDAVNAIAPSARGELEISDAHDYLLKNNYRVGHGEITGWWKDTGMPTDPGARGARGPPDDGIAG